ncbi:MAG: S41 family peptidase [Acinetobacter pittii]|jgi:hypothetical protein|nr:S41 family peptidase [Acinetobacter pittii]
MHSGYPSVTTVLNHTNCHRYNRVFPAPARSVTNTPTGVNGIWASIGDWTDGAQLSLKFGNGTEKTIQKTATPSEKFFSYGNGTRLYEIACLPRDLSTASSSLSGAEEASSEIEGLPSTTWRSSANSIAGYYSKLSGLEDTAIIFLPTFSSSASEVSKIAVDFLQNSTESGKKNVLIDLSSNPGGYMSIGIDLSRIFFPNAAPYTATRFRAHDAAEYLTKAYSRDGSTDTSNVFAYRQMVRPDQRTGFSSWEDLYGPHEILGSSASSLLANFNYTSTSSKNFPINGYGPVPLNPSKSPFPADNIAIVRVCPRKEYRKEKSKLTQVPITDHRRRLCLNLRVLRQADETPGCPHYHLRRPSTKGTHAGRRWR